MRDFITIPYPSLLLSAAGSFAVVACLIPPLIHWAKNNKLFGPTGSRHIHTRPTVRLGGLAITFSILLASFIALGFSPALMGFYLGLFVVCAVGLLDDLYDVPPYLKLSAQIFAAALLIFFGSSVSTLTNPFGGTILLPPLVDIALSVTWVVLVINSINFLDGMDGLAGGVSAIAAVTITVLSLFAIVNQPSTAQLAAIIFGAAAGFLVYNWHPAKLFMGDSGSHALGFSLATVSIISGSKLATAALVLGIPIIDLGWSAIRRIRSGKHPWVADGQHLHHQLLARGLSQPTIVGSLYVISVLLGVVSLVASTPWKIVSFLAAIGIVVLLLRLARIRSRS